SRREAVPGDRQRVRERRAALRDAGRAGAGGAGSMGGPGAEGAPRPPLELDRLGPAPARRPAPDLGLELHADARLRSAREGGAGGGTIDDGRKTKDERRKTEARGRVILNLRPSSFVVRRSSFVR